MSNGTAETPRIRGDWIPHNLIEPDFAPLAQWPPRPLSILKFFFGWPGYMFPRPALYLLATVLIWLFVVPGGDVTSSLAWSWVILLLVFNAVLTLAANSLWHLPLYVFRSQGEAFKYNKRFPDQKNPNFFMNSQMIDNAFYTFAWSVPVMTAWVVFAVWMQSAGHSPVVSWQERPIYLALLIFLVPIWHTVHFHVAHWLMHQGPIYKLVHSVHHRNVNAGPWTGLAFHPVEAFLFFAPVWLFLVIPSHPLVALWAIYFAFFTATPAHIGFGHVVVTPSGRTIDVDVYHHYLHHRYHECNYSGTPLDKWFGTWHDGSVECHEQMKARLKRRNVAR